MKSDHQATPQDCGQRSAEEWLRLSGEAANAKKRASNLAFADSIMAMAMGLAAVALIGLFFFDALDQERRLLAAIMPCAAMGLAIALLRGHIQREACKSRREAAILDAAGEGHKECIAAHEQAAELAASTQSTSASQRPKRI